MLQLYWCGYSCLSREIRKYLTSIVVLPAEISAAAVLVTFWTPAGQTDSTCSTGICNNAMWVGLMLIVVVWAFPKNWTTSDTDDHLVRYQLCGNTSLWWNGILVLFNQGKIRGVQSQNCGDTDWYRLWLSLALLSPVLSLVLVVVLTTRQSDSNFGTKLVDSHSMKALVSINSVPQRLPVSNIH